MIGSKATVQLADELLGIARKIDPSLEPKYNKHYIGLWKADSHSIFALFGQERAQLILKLKCRSGTHL